MILIFIFGALLSLIALLSMFIFGYIFLGGSKPGANIEQDQFIKKTCNPNEGLLKSVLTWGYAKASYRRFRVDLSTYMMREPIAKVGNAAPDAALVSIDGKEMRLLRDFVDKMPKGMPLVLNFGSFT